jgi:hypothetical protein
MKARHINRRIDNLRLDSDLVSQPICHHAAIRQNDIGPAIRPAIPAPKWRQRAVKHASCQTGNASRRQVVRITVEEASGTVAVHDNSLLVARRNLVCPGARVGYQHIQPTQMLAEVPNSKRKQGQAKPVAGPQPRHQSEPAFDDAVRIDAGERRVRVEKRCKRRRSRE